jgi:uncharacterized paraquat-inducible protein A
MSFKLKPSKTLKCKKCGILVENVGNDADAVTCWRCVSEMMRGNRLESQDDLDEEPKEGKK